jgi:hypothetical protein
MLAERFMVATFVERSGDGHGIPLPRTARVIRRWTGEVWLPSQWSDLLGATMEPTDYFR